MDQSELHLPYLELAALIRGALALADKLELADVGISLDQALNHLVALDASGSIQGVPFELPPLRSKTSETDISTRAA